MAVTRTIPPKLEMLYQEAQHLRFAAAHLLVRGRPELAKSLMALVSDVQGREIGPLEYEFFSSFDAARSTD